MAAEPTGSGSVRTVLERGDIDIEGRMPWSSNGTYLVTVRHGADELKAIYKPRAGERALWDFPAGLDRREVAAFELSEQLGWNLVPTTVLRDGPLGQGSVQRFVEADFEQHYFTMFEAGRHLDRWRAMCAFDIVANNTDRKSGHCLVSTEDEPFGIDHGLCFHEDFKLRTVIWEFAAEPLPQEIIDGLEQLRRDGLNDALTELLRPEEADAVLARVEQLLAWGHFPVDGSGHRYPWPLV